MSFPKFCSSCGAPLYPGSKFCAKCGNRIVVIEDAPKEDVVKEVTPVQEEPILEAPQQPQEEIVETPVVEKEPEPVVEEAPVEEPETIEEQPVEEPVETKEEITEQEPVVEPVKEEPKPVEEIKTEDPVVEETPVVEQPAPAPEVKSEITDVDNRIRVAAALGGYVFGALNTQVDTDDELEKVDDLLEPRKKYIESLEKEHVDTVSQYFDELVKESGVDVNANLDAMRERSRLERNKTLLEAKMKKVSSNRFLTNLGILFMILPLSSLIIIGIFGFTGVLEEFPWILENLVTIAIVGAIIFVLSIVFFVAASIKKKRGTRKYGPLIEEAEKKIKELEEIGYQQLAPLNNAFEFNILNQMMRKTTPLIHLDDHPDMNKVECLVNKYNWNRPDGRYNSSLYMKTGSILGNPFVLYRGKAERTVNETYTGSLTITYTKKVTIGKNTTYIPVVQTLTASVTKPRPDFYTETMLVYGNEAAPNLSFSRHPMISKYDKKSLDKLFKEREKFVDDYAKKHPNFTPLGNDEFEDFFDGLDRDNEVEYRLLFTPLAQRSILDLIKNSTPTGDNFSLTKRRMLNTVILRGNNDIDFEGDPRIFMGFDLEKVKDNFIAKNKEFFKSMYFHFAPLMAIPLYQQYPSNEYIFRHNQDKVYSTALCEMLANRYYQQYFAHEACHTPIILKCDQYHIVGNSIQCLMHSYGYHSVAHVEICPRMGGDGHMHDVPVTWYEYQLVEKTTPFVIHESFLTKKEFELLRQEKGYSDFYSKLPVDQFSFFKGYFTFTERNQDKYDPQTLNELITNKFNND